jgi:hypothetical protein
MRISRLFLAAAATLALGACNTTSQIEQRAADQTRCREYGFRPGSDAFSKCLLQVDLDRSADRRARMDYPRFYGGRGGYWNRYWW